MQKWLLGALVLGVGIAFLLFRGDEAITNYPSAGSDIVAFGDSLVAGVGASTGKDFVSLLAGSIGRPVINLGVSGDTTKEGLARVGELDRYEPKVVLLLLGGNDYLRRVPPEETFNNLQKIIEEIHARGAVVLLVGVRGGVLRDNFDERYEELALKNNTAYVPDILDGLLGKREFMSDQVHPNDAGYAKIAARLAPVLKKLLE
jgi:acyl-CoA thioesterase-1